jgi:hypothetical protein
MITKPNLTIGELKQLWVEILLNKTDKVSDVSDDSVLNGVAFGDSTVGQKAMKDIVITEAKIFPQYAKGEYLDESANLFGVSERRSAVGSSTYLKLIADTGTSYVAATNLFTGNNGIQFEMEEDFTMGSLGVDYIKVRSVDSGLKTNVDANTITTVSPIPSGHTAAINEYKATGGIDNETDEVFRLRIVNNNNIVSLTTLEYYNQVFQNLDDRILKVLNLGKDENGKQVLAIVTQNGVDLTQNELDSLLEQATPFFPISDLNQFGGVLGVTLQNVEWYEVNGSTGIDFRVEIDPNYIVDDVRKDIQINLSKKLDFRFWEAGDRVEWDDLFEVVKNTEGVKYVPDDYFNPSEDESVPSNQLPRIKVFVMRNLDGNIIFDAGGALSPIFYPVE